jgi:tripartite-type tricarboxylate transporter receptor subunit TctC
MVLVASNKVPANTIQEFIALGKKSEPKLSYSSSGIGSVSHLMYEVFRAGAGIESLHVPYKGGGQAIGDVVAGHIDATMATIPVAKGMIEARQIKGLAVTSDKRSSVLPTLPTLNEAGVKTAGVEMTFWWGMFGPAGMPEPVKEKLANAVATIMKKPDLQERFAKLNLDPAYGPAPEMKALLVREINGWAKFIDDNGIKAE